MVNIDILSFSKQFMIGTAHNTNEVKFLLQRCIQDLVSNTIIITLSAKKKTKKKKKKKHLKFVYISTDYFL